MTCKASDVLTGGVRAWREAQRQARVRAAVRAQRLAQPGVSDMTHAQRLRLAISLCHDILSERQRQCTRILQQRILYEH